MAVRLTQFFSIVIVAVGGGGILAALVVCGDSIGHVYVDITVHKIETTRLLSLVACRPMAGRVRGLQKSLVLTFNSIGQQLSNNGLVILISALFASAVIPSFYHAPHLDQYGWRRNDNLHHRAPPRHD